MENWHENHIEDLTVGIVNEFDYVFNRIVEDSDVIYGVAISLDSDILTGFLALGTINTNSKNERKYKNWDCKWTPEEWEIYTKSNEIDNGIVSLFLDEMRRHFDNDIEPELMNGADYTEEREKNYWLYMEGMKNAKKILQHKYKEELKNALFYLSIPGDEVFEIETAKKLNEPSELLAEMIREKSGL